MGAVVDDIFHSCTLAPSGMLSHGSLRHRNRSFPRVEDFQACRLAPFEAPPHTSFPSRRIRGLGHGDACATRAGEGLDGHDLEVVRVAETMLSPEVEVVAGRHRAGRALALTHRPILRKGTGASD